MKDLNKNQKAMTEYGFESCMTLNISSDLEFKYQKILKLLIFIHNDYHPTSIKETQRVTQMPNRNRRIFVCRKPFFLCSYDKLDLV